MEMQITPDWLRKKIETEPELEIEAGIPTFLLQNLDAFLPKDVVPVEGEGSQQTREVRHAFGVLVRMLRLEASMDIAQLAETARVMAEEIEQIERDVDTVVRPRTVHKLAKVFRIEPKQMAILSGSMTASDRELTDEVVKFAAKSDGVSRLNAEEQKILNGFISFLKKKA